jgi:hypothetical protein
MFIDEDALDDEIVLSHLDPFYRECRAFGRLVEEGRDHELAVRCYGYFLLPKSIERRLHRQFGIHDWRRQPEHSKEPLRAIVKDYIWHKSAYGRNPLRQLPVMRSRIEQLHNLGIYNMDIREDNYRNSRLFDFSLAITSPHISLSLRLWSIEKIERDINDDLGCFDDLAEELEERLKQQRSLVIAKLRPRVERYKVRAGMLGAEGIRV